MSIFSRSVLSAVFASSLSGFLISIFMAYLGPFLDILGTIALIVGMIFFSRNFFQIFLRIPFSEVSQMYGRKPLISIGIAFYTFAFVLMWLSTNWLTVLLATILVAIGMSAYWPAMFSYIGDITTDNYGMVNGIIFQGSDAGIIVGTLLAKFLLENNIVDLRGLFLYSFFIGLLGTILVFLTLSESLNNSDKQKSENLKKELLNSFTKTWDSFIIMSRKSPLWVIYMFQFIVSFTEFFYGSFISLFIIRSKGFTEADVASIILYSTITIVFFKPFLGKVSDKFGFKWPVLISLSINATILVTLTFVDSFFMITVLYGTLVASSVTSYLAVNGATSYSSPTPLRGLAMGALGSYVSLGRSASSIVMTPIWEILERITGDRGESLSILFQITASIIFVSVIILYLLSRKVDLESKAETEIE